MTRPPILCACCVTLQRDITSHHTKTPPNQTFSPRKKRRHSSGMPCAGVYSSWKRISERSRMLPPRLVKSSNRIFTSCCSRCIAGTHRGARYLPSTSTGSQTTCDWQARESVCPSHSEHKPLPLGAQALAPGHDSQSLLYFSQNELRVVATRTTVRQNGYTSADGVTFSALKQHSGFWIRFLSAQRYSLWTNSPDLHLS